MVQLAADTALHEAKQADEVLARGDLTGPLHGLPFTVKDWIETRGVVCTAGEERHRQYVSKHDATVVSRLRQAGGIFLGKTNVVNNPVYGRTNNPYNLEYTPADSSSGEAAIIAAGGSPLGLGSDSGGSIRQPAHNCGIAGLKPSTGRIPLTGHFPRINPLSDPRTAIGPMARYVEDLALVLPIMGGMDWQDASVIPMPLSDWREVDLKRLRVAFYTSHEHAKPTLETDETVRRAAQALTNLGLETEEALPERVEEAYAITRAYWQRPESESWEKWAPDGEVTLSNEEVEQHLFQWDRFRRCLIRFMARYDVVLTPVAEQPAVRHGEPEGGIPYTLPYSLTGYPCAVVRGGTSPEGLPIGVQVVARPWRDDVALAVAHLLERALGGYQRPVLTP
ncbi:MAG: amidase [Deinococcota bacterium]|nr:amidase [Deinococcota bacterium]